MELRLEREIFTPTSTIGQLFIDGIWQCWTLEDVVRKGPKVPGKTAIPEGRYRVIISFSGRFQRLMPELLAVPGFTGIRIHPGNTDADTEGCILVGQTRGPDWIGASRLAYAGVFARLNEVFQKSEPIFISIETAEAERQAWP